MADAAAPRQPTADRTTIPVDDADEWMEPEDYARESAKPLKAKQARAHAAGLTGKRRKRRHGSDDDEEYAPTAAELREAEAEEAEALREEEEASRAPPANDEEEDADDGEEDEDAEVIRESKPRCQYWESCYRTNPVHLAAFRHPPKRAAAR